MVNPEKRIEQLDPKSTPVDTDLMYIGDSEALIKSTRPKIKKLTFASIKAWILSSTTNVWGSITGTLSDQADLKSALDAKENSLGFTPENVSNKKTTLTDSDIDYPTTKAVNNGLDTKQNTLVSGTNIKTIDGESILGSGNIEIFNTGYVEKTSNYTLTANDYTVNCTANTFTITLPTAIDIQGKIYNIKNSGTGEITIDANGSETIDGQLTQIITQWGNVKIQSTNAGWIIL